MPKFILKSMWTESQVEVFCEKRGGEKPANYPYKSGSFAIIDFNWEDSLWSHWENKAKANPEFWMSLGEAVLKNWSQEWENTLKADVKQLGRTTYKDIEHGALKSEWIYKLSAIPCLPDRL